MLEMMEYGFSQRAAIDELLNRVSNRHTGYRNIRCLKPAEAAAMRLTASDWDALHSFSDVLQPFKSSTLILQKSTYPSCGLAIPMLEMLIKEVEAKRGPFGRPEYGAFCGKALEKLREYRSKIFTEFGKAASLLDPRCRRLLGCCGVSNEEQEALLVRAWRENYGDDDEDGTGGSGGPLKYFAALGGNSTCRPDTVKVEVARWLNEPVMATDLSSQQVASYMRGIGGCFPRIQKMAADVLAAPATSISCESAFSRVGLVTSKRRRRLGDDAIRAIVELQAWKDVPVCPQRACE
eukprot:GHVU01234130.1.p2 GENE.GHVU01234130.1~~GHVU01234130.1.p2  ORF type:complete len:293 (+),score=32.96 GHVU01234130.1:2228-3106(+)